MSKTTQSTWHVLTLEGYVGGFNTLSDAVDEVQCVSGADRPTRFAAGFYEMTSASEEYATTFYLCTTKMAIRQGFDWIKELNA